MYVSVHVVVFNIRLVFPFRNVTIPSLVTPYLGVEPVVPSGETP